MHKDTQTDIHTTRREIDRKTNVQTYGQTDTQRHRHADRETDMQTYT